MEHHNTQGDVKKFVLTGGPCGGKSSALAMIHTRFEGLGYKVYSVPEAATLLFTGGGRFSQWNTLREMAFETNKIKTQIALEDAFMNLAKHCGKKAIVICDRGTLDSCAYVNAETWGLILDHEKWTTAQLREERYDAAIHLVTAANGAEKFYTRMNNATRSETVEQAKDVDQRIMQAWIGHPRFFIVDNSTDFAGKLDRVMDILSGLMGLPSSSIHVRKYLVQVDEDQIEKAIERGNKLGFPNSGGGGLYKDGARIAVEKFDCEYTFLLRGGKGTEEGYIFLEKRGQNGNSTYKYSVKYKIDETNGSNTNSNDNNKDEQQQQVQQPRFVVDERRISGAEYASLMEQVDPSHHIAKKLVRCFTWEGHYIEISKWKEGGPCSGLVTMKTDLQILDGESVGRVENSMEVIVNSSSVDQSIEQEQRVKRQELVQLPPFITVKKDVTDDNEYSTFALTMKK